MIIIVILIIMLLLKLFKSHCCSCFGSQAWRIDSSDYERIYYMVEAFQNYHYYTTHTWILGPLFSQPHIYCQSHQHTVCFLYSIQNNFN